MASNYDPTKYLYQIKNTYGGTEIGSQYVTLYTMLRRFNLVTSQITDRFVQADQDLLSDINNDISLKLNELQEAIESEFSNTLNFKGSVDQVSDLNDIIDPSTGDIYAHFDSDIGATVLYICIDGSFVPLGSGGEGGSGGFDSEDFVDKVTFNDTVDDIESSLLQHTQKISKLLSDYTSLAERVGALERIEIGEDGLELGDVDDLKNFSNGWNVDPLTGTMRSSTGDVIVRTDDGDEVSLKSIAGVVKPSTLVKETVESVDEHGTLSTTIENVDTLFVATDQDIIDFVFSEEVSDPDISIPSKIVYFGIRED